MKRLLPGLILSLFDFYMQDPFPLHAICGSPWKNTLGQLSLLKYAVLAPPEVFTFAHSGRLLVDAFSIIFLFSLTCNVLILTSE